MAGTPISASDAIQYVRDHPGIGLDDLKDLVSRLEFSLPEDTVATVLYSGQVGGY